MGYLTTSSRAASLTINGVDYTGNLMTFQVSDASAFKNGLVSTTGSILLKSYGNSPQMEDYDRDNFRRGAVVTLDVTTPAGATVRHPRGYLYVLSTSYDPDNDALSVEVGCRLALAALTEDVSELLPLVPVPLDPAQRTYPNISASFATAGQYLYQDNQGALQSDDYFSGDTTAGTAPGEWTSVLGTTALAVSPLSGSGAIPDEVELSYQVPSDAISSDQTGKVDLTSTESYYFLNYPAILFIKKPTLPTPAPPTAAPVPPPNVSGCGNIPDPPSGEQTGGGVVVSCSEGYETKQQVVYVTARRVENTRTEYSGPGGQVSRTYSETFGPGIEANPQYYADKYSYCRYSYANSCAPDGYCPMDGQSNIKLGYTEQINYYGPANELIKTVQDTYLTRLSAAQPSDWRSGEVNGKSSSFRTLSANDLYRYSRVQTEYNYRSNENIQETTTWTSISSRQSGITGGNLDALAGIKTFQRRISTTITANPISPDIVNDVQTNTTERRTNIILFNNRFVSPPNQAGPYITKESLPVPVLFSNPSSINSIVNSYANYLARFLKGDSFGLTITETLRPEIITNWRPGMPFRYSDPRKQKILAMRMDACTWGVSPNECIVATNGIWVGISNGNLTIGPNLSGNSSPNMSGGAPSTPPAVSGPPGVSGETNVDSGNFFWEIDVNVYMDSFILFWGEDGVDPILPSDTVYDIGNTLTMFVTGFSVAPGSLLQAGPGGSFPLEYNGSLLTTNPTIVDDNLFA